MARGRPPKKMETALAKFHEAAGLKADEILSVVPQACEAIAPSERRPVAIAGRIIDMVAIEGLARIGLTYEEVLRKLRLKPTDLNDRPDVESAIREACDAGSVDLIEEHKRNLVELSAKNPVSNIFALKSLCPDQFDEKVRRDKNKQTGQNAQDVLTGLVQMMIERNRIQNDEIRNAIAEQRSLSQANAATVQNQRLPQLGTRNEVTGKPIITVEPIDAIMDDFDETEHSVKRQQLPDTSAADALKSTVAKLAAHNPSADTPVSDS